MSEPEGVQADDAFDELVEPQPDLPIEVVVIGASAGGVEALGRLIGGLESRLEAAVLIVLHIAPTASSVLPSVLARSGHLPAFHARDGQPIAPGQIIVAPPDHHMVLEGSVVRLNRGPRVNGVRPAVDPLFQSAATSFGPRAMGIVLSGMLDDGTVGLASIKAAGGITAVQDPSEAAYPQMPSSAVAAGAADHVLSVDKLADFVAESTSSAVAPIWDRPDSEDGAMESTEPEPGDEVTGISCPSCGGVLWEHRDPAAISFRCRIGHAFSSASLFDAQSGALDLALWAAVRALEERAALGRRLAQRLRTRGQPRLALRYERIVNEADTQAGVIKRVITKAGPHEDMEQVE
jgi:two-component system chemotaxis response regulator CheB